jgi:ribulose-phosphate 3-epimerase
MTVLPVINCLDFKSAKERLKLAEKFLKKDDWIHLDVADGVFTHHKSWRSPSELANLRLKFRVEVHLMVEHPERQIDAWLAAGADRFIIHAETITEDTARAIVARARRRRVEVMLSSSPLTSTTELWPLLKHFSHFQVLAVDPGPANQKFIPIVLQKIKFLRNFSPSAMIEVDGGVNLEIAKEVKKAGANFITSSGFIWNDKDPGKAYKKLLKV